MSYFNIKICGITRPSDAVLASKLGANMLGLIFYSKSPRYVNLKTASSIVKVIPPTVSRVGVFVDYDIKKILNTADKHKLDFIQFHGDYKARDIRIAKLKGFKTIQAFSIKEKKDYQKVYNSITDLILIDNKTDLLAGGTGKRFDWGIRPPRKIKNLVLAGGIDKRNVKKGINIFSPLVIDVSSSVESSPGKKSSIKLKEFFRVCNGIRYERKI